MAKPTLSRSDIKKTPGRLVFTFAANSFQSNAAHACSIYSKLGTMIERKIVHELTTIGTDAAGELDYRDKEYYAKVSITPDGRFQTHTAACLWPYGAYVPGTPIFAAAINNTLVIHGSDTSLETFESVALEVMPPLKFTATETIVGQAEFLCLRPDAQYWSATSTAGLLVQADSGGTLTDTAPANADVVFTPANILTGPYFMTWNPATPLTIAAATDTLDGITVEFSIQWSDDNRQSIGLSNRRIKAINCRVRCTPLGQTRQTILAAQQAQGTGAVRGRSIQAGNSADLQIVDYNEVVMFTLKNAALTEDKQNWSSEAVRETDLVWQGTRSYSAGVLGALFTVLS